MIPLILFFLILNYSVLKLNKTAFLPRGGGGVGGWGYSLTLPIRVCAAQRGRDFEAPDLEGGSGFRGVF